MIEDAVNKKTTVLLRPKFVAQHKSKPYVAEKKKLIFTVVKMLLLTLAGIVMAFPFVWMMLSALKTKQELMDVSILVPAIPQWQNFTQVLFNSPIPRYIFNSFFVSITSVAYQLLSSALFAYALVFMNFKGKNLLFAVVLACYMVPGVATYIPGYALLSNLGIIDTYEGIILSYTVSIFGIFLLRQAFMQIPKEMKEASQMDNASHLQMLCKVIFPLTKPTFISFALISFITTYNSYMWPSLITNKPELSLVSQGLGRFFIEGGAYGTNWVIVMAASTVVVVPLLVMFVVIQKWFVAGIGADSGVKG